MTHIHTHLSPHLLVRYIFLPHLLNICKLYIYIKKKKLSYASQFDTACYSQPSNDAICSSEKEREGNFTFLHLVTLAFFFSGILFPIIHFESLEFVLIDILDIKSQN